jgi:Raf kinase inhibitor-like YbhB/YbcL family protein
MRWSALLILVVMTGPALGRMAGAREAANMGDLHISSPAFVHNGTIPVRHTCDGGDVSPSLTITGVPASARSLALIVDDPDAPGGDWVHWVVWNIPPTTTSLGENALPPGSHQGKNGWGKNSYGGPCPPSGSHRYFFKFYALDSFMELPLSTTKKGLEAAMDGHIVARGEFIGLYKRR